MIKQLQIENGQVSIPQYLYKELPQVFQDELAFMTDVRKAFVQVLVGCFVHPKWSKAYLQTLHIVLMVGNTLHIISESFVVDEKRVNRPLLGIATWTLSTIPCIDLVAGYDKDSCIKATLMNDRAETVTMQLYPRHINFSVEMTDAYMKQPKVLSLNKGPVLECPDFNRELIQWET